MAGVEIQSLIRTIPDYPKPGILFRDITTLIADPAGFRAAIDGLVLPFLTPASTTSSASRRADSSSAGQSPTSSAAASFRSARRASSPATIGQEYSLEYGVDTIEIHADAIGRVTACCWSTT